ncbi:MAG: alternative ribosome rescue aminoacyl-tRNA hydrolase ArfB [Bacteroidales bacterium]|jgi:ribosome-associated protein
MVKRNLKNIGLEKEFTISASLSSGPGGQHVNKVNTKIMLHFNVMKSGLLTDNEKTLLMKKLKSRVNKNGDLVVSSQSERSQIRNRDLAVSKFYNVLEKAMKPTKKRIPTKPTKASLKKKQENKIKHSIKKKLRKTPDQ